MKRVLLLGYVKNNLGDDLFISMLLNRYSKINFEIHVTNYKYTSTFQKYKNVSFVVDSFYDIQNIDNYESLIYIAGSVFQEIKKGLLLKQKELNLINRFKEKNIPVLYISSNYGPEYTQEFYNVCNNIISQLDSISFRDIYSYDKFKNYNHVKYYPDLVYSLNYNKKETIKDSVGISVINTFKTNRSYQYDSIRYYKLLEDNIKKYIDAKKDVYLFSFCNIENDESMIEHLYNGLNKKYQNHIKKVYYQGNIFDFLDKYSAMEYMICTRFHSLILSSIFNHKIFVLSYSDKIKNSLISENISLPYIGFNDKYICKDVDLKEFEKMNTIKLEDIRIRAKQHFEATDKMFKNTIINDKYDMKNAYCRISPIRRKIKNMLGEKIKDKKTFDNLNLLNRLLINGNINKNSYNNCLTALGNKHDKSIKVKDIVEGPLLSIVVPTYKRADYLENCLNSIFRQNYKNIEVIIIDDYPHSKNYPNIMSKFKKYKSKINYFKNESNLGAGKSRQKGYSKATGKYVIFCDDDDFYIDDMYFANAISDLEKDDKLSFVSYNAVNFYEKEKVIDENPLMIKGIIDNQLFLKNFQTLCKKPVSTFTTVFRKDPLDKIKFSDVSMMNDSIIYSYSLVASNYKIKISDTIIGCYRLHSINLSNNLSAQFMIDNLAENENIFRIIQTKQFIPNPLVWWYNKVSVISNYYINDSKPKIKEYLKYRRWCTRHLHGGSKSIIKEMDKKWLAMSLKKCI